MPAVKQYEEHILMRHQRCCVFWGILDFKAILDSRTEKTNVKRNTTITFSLVLVKCTCSEGSSNIFYYKWLWICDFNRGCIVAEMI